MWDGARIDVKNDAWRPDNPLISDVDAGHKIP